MFKFIEQKSSIFIISFIIFSFIIYGFIYTLLRFVSIDENNTVYLSEQANSMPGKDVNFFVDHSIIMSDYHGSFKYINEADVLFTGSSRSQFAYNNDVLKKYFSSKNLKFFNLSMDYGESMEFFIKYAKKYNIRNKIVVINPDGYFRDYLSPPAQLSTKIFPQVHAYVSAKYIVNYLYPIILKEFGFTRIWRISRDWKTGTIDLRDFPKGNEIEGKAQYKIINHDDEMIATVIPLWQKFLKFAYDRNLIIVYAPVPSGIDLNQYSIYDIKKIANAFDIAVLDIDDSNLNTCDGSHLNNSSAVTFTERFVVAFDKLLEGKTIEEYKISKSIKTYIIEPTIPGMFMDYNSPSLSYKDGWSIFESTHIWSDGKNASIDLSMHNISELKGVLELKFVTNEIQNVIIYLNKALIFDGELNYKFPGETLILDVDKHLFKNGENEISFELPNARQPSNRDTRFLAVGLQGLTVR